MADGYKTQATHTVNHALMVMVLQWLSACSL